jgi:hypothetical protein
MNMKLLSLRICASALLLGAVSVGVNKPTWNRSVQAAVAPDSITPQGQPPGWSRGQQNLSITYDECMRRAPAALQAEGYRRDDQPGGNFAVGIKEVHTAVIICSPAPDAKMLVHIVVASNGDGGGVERQRLQAQMERPGPAARPGSLTWQQVGIGDCSGNDDDQSDGFMPDIRKAQADHIAICWDGGTYNNLYVGSGKAFCTYKRVAPSQCSGGKYPGVMYGAVRQ